jgi:zinc protease
MKKNKALFGLAAVLSAVLITFFSGVELMAQEGVYREKLDNGLTVIIKENHAAPIVACNFWVKTGAAFENDNEKGMSHFIEHMMFKGTAVRKVGDIDREIKSLGGYNNAFTSYDATNFVIVLPSDQVAHALDIEYDALTASVFDPDEFNKEREVILSELNRGLDNPEVFLWQKFMDLSFDRYYKDPIIGFAAGLKEMKRDSLVEYYRKFYTPDNIIVVVSGDVKTQKVMEYVKKTFGTMKPGTGESKPVLSMEAGPIKQEIKFEAIPGQIESTYLAVGFRIPDALSKDIPALEILARALSGSESSPLYQSLKEEKQLVDEVDSDIFTGKFGGMFVISANVREGKFAEAFAEIFRQLDRIKKEGIKSEQLMRVKMDVAREDAREDMQVENGASNLGYYETMGDYNLYYAHNDAVKRVLDSDVSAVMNNYLDPDAVSVIIYYPEKMKKEFGKYKGVDDIKKFIQTSSPEKNSEEGKVTKTVLPNGITLIHKKLTNAAVVDMKFMFRGGIVYEGTEEGAFKGVTNLMMQSMMKGTKTMDYKQLSEALDDIGAVLSKDIKRDAFGWSAEVTPANLEPFMKVYSDIILNPTFPVAEVKKEKTDIINQIDQIKDSPASYLTKLFNGLFFDWHPYGYPTIGEADTVKKLDINKLKSWHDNYVTPNNLIVSVVGDVDADQIKDLLNIYFKGWKPGKESKPKLPVRITDEKKTLRETIDKNQSHIMIGFLGPKTNSEDYFPMRVLDNILSGGMYSRLFTEIRDKRNLCYTIFSTFDRNIENGAIRIYTATSPENEQKAVTEIFKVLSDMREGGVTDEEIKNAKSYIIGMYKVGLQDYMSQADSYLSYELWGMGYKKVDDFVASIEAVKKSEVNAVFKKYYRLENYTQVIVGPAEKKVNKSDKDKQP